MAKLIKYKLNPSVINKGTQGKPILENFILNVTIECKTEEQYKLNYPIAEREAIFGTIEVVGEYEEQPQTTEDKVNELEAALALLLEGATE